MQNLIKDNFLTWELINSIEEEKSFEFSVSENGEIAIISDLREEAAMKRLVKSFGIEDGVTYRIEVPFKAEKLKGELSVCATISLYNSDGVWIRKFYLDREEEKFVKVFKSEGETKVQVELGLKTYGKVEWELPLLYETKSLEKRIVKLASAQVCHGGNEITYAENLVRIENAIIKASSMGADIVCFPETANDRGVSDYKCFSEFFEPTDGRFNTFMKEKAKEYEIFLFYTLHEIDEKGIRRNAAYLIDKKGNVAGRYFKSHLTIYEYENGMLPGDNYSVFDTVIGKIGLLVCWDAYFPEPARQMALEGAEILLVSTAGNPTHRHIARAKENGVYVVVSCVDKTCDSCIYPTKIIDPRGEILAEAKEEGDIAFAEVDLNEDKYINWLSVGAADAEPNNIYMNELRTDKFKFQK